MKKLMIIACCLMHLAVHAQLKKEVAFTVSERWLDILKRSKIEKKPIFIDAYATWCGPCKMMDNTVYNDPIVADFTNQNYIAVKVQIDKTKNDALIIKNWYKDAESLQRKYNIVALPTFLFISPENELLYKAEGYFNPEQFLSLLKTAKDPKVGYSKLIKAYKSGKTDGKLLLGLALRAKQYHEDSLALVIAKKYKKEIIDQNKPSTLLSEALREYLIAFASLFHFHDPLIKYISSNPVIADSALKQSGFSIRIKEYFIVKDVINPMIKSNGQFTLQEPNWAIVEKEISSNCDERTTKKLILNAKLNWFGDKKDWANIVKYNIEKTDLLGIDTAGLGRSVINNMVFEIIFQHSTDGYALNKGIQYMETILKTANDRDTWIDTYANLLYKAGRRDEAIIQEQQALAIVTKKGFTESIAEYQKTIEKMINNLPTWEVVKN